MPRSREELVEALRELASREWDPDCPATDAPTRVVTEAADLLDSLEECYRVVADEGPLHEGTGLQLTDPNTLAAAEKWAAPEHWPASYENVRIQQRYETPWTDVEEGTDGC